MPAIDIQKLTKKFGDFTAVNAIEFSVASGEIFGFLGPNGSGKTTTIRMLLGLLRPTSGTAYILGRDIREGVAPILRQIGYMSQKFSLYGDLTVLDNLRFFGRGYGLSGKELQKRIDFVLEMADLKGRGHTRTDELSGGWAQRLALGASIIHQPGIIFLDEPTAGVDPVSRREFWELLYRLSQEGTTIFVTTHYMDEAEHCHTVGFISYGDMIAYGSPTEIVRQATPGKVISLEVDNPPEALKILNTAMDTGQFNASTVSLFGAAVHVITTQTEQTRKTVLALLKDHDIEVNSVNIMNTSLEDAFIELTHHSGAPQRA